MSALYSEGLFKEASKDGGYLERAIARTPNPEALRRVAKADGRKGAEVKALKRKAEADAKAKALEEANERAAREAAAKALREDKARSEHPALFDIGGGGWHWDPPARRRR